MIMLESLGDQRIQTGKERSMERPYVLVYQGIILSRKTTRTTRIRACIEMSVGVGSCQIAQNAFAPCLP